MAGVDGPDGLWSEELAPSRGQYKTIALLALQLLGADAPASRYDASLLTTRLKATIAGDGAPGAELASIHPF